MLEGGFSGATKYFKISASPNAVSVGFVGRVSRIARVHQEGLNEQVRPNGSRDGLINGVGG